jgi:hypothetical protein
LVPALDIAIPSRASAHFGRGAPGNGGGGGGSLPALNLTSAVTSSSSPWTFGQAFKQGDVPSGKYLTATNTSAFQADVRNLWPDGSAKFAVLSGVSSLTASTQKSIQLSTTSTAPSGSNVAAPSSLTNTYVTLGVPGSGSYPIASGTAGTYNINSCLAVSTVGWSRTAVSLVRKILGPVMSEFHYWQPCNPTASQLGIWWYLRVYSNGDVDVECKIENGCWQLTSPSPSEQDYTVSVIINGVTVYTSGSSVISHLSHTWWGRVDWYSFGGAQYIGSPLVPAHNGAYLMASKVVPNFGWTAPAASTLTSFYQQSVNPSPFVLDQSGTAYGDLSTALDATGSSPWIGLLTQWEALYVTTGQNGSFTAAELAQLYAATPGNTRQAGAFLQHYRDETTGRIPIWSSYVNYSVTNGQGTLPPTIAGGTPPTWDATHMPDCGYLAYLIEGRWSQLEELQQSAWFVIQDEYQIGNFGSLQALHAQLTTRGFAWAVRSAGQAAAFSPTSLGVLSNGILTADSNVRSSFMTSVSDTASLNKQLYIDGTATLSGGYSVVNSIGWIGQYDQYTGSPIPSTEWWGGSWMVAFQGMALGHIADLGIEELTNQGQLEALRNFVWLDNLQMTQGSTTEYNLTWNFRRLATYERPYLGSSSGPTDPTFLATNQAGLPLSDYQTTFGLSATLTANPGDSIMQHGSDSPIAAGDTSEFGGEGYGAMHASVLAMAAEKAIPKAALRYALVTAASNWSPQAMGASDGPQMSIAPRAGVIPSWYPSAAGQWVTLPGGSLSASGVLAAADAEIMADWTSAIVNTVGIYLGSTWSPGIWLMCCMTGHTDSGNGHYAYGPIGSGNEVWYQVRPPTSPAPSYPPIADANGNPVARHTYDGVAFLPNQNAMFMGGLFSYPNALECGQFLFDYCFPSPNGSGQPWTQLPTQSPNGDTLCSVYDPFNDCVWCWNTSYNIAQYFPSTRTWAGGSNGYLTYNEHNPCSALDTKRGIWAIWLGASSNTGYSYALLFYDTYTGTITNSVYQPTTTGTGPPLDDASILYDPNADCFVVSQGGQALWTLTPPATNPYSGGNAWTWASMSVGGVTPSAWPVNGVYKRFNIVQGNGWYGYVYVAANNESTYFFRVS